MSTSPEAKQATGWHYKPVSIAGSPKATRFTVYDESGEPIVSVYMRSDAERICSTVNTATAKAREELENERFTRAHWEERAEKAETQLAHQQPGAPTADVEKLEWRLWSHGDNRVIVYQNNATETIITPQPVSSEQGEWLRQHHNEALAQARAPLVEALEEIRATGGSSVCLRAWHKCLEIADAALTGTEISRVKEGEESNQIKKEINDDAR